MNIPVKTSKKYNYLKDLPDKLFYPDAYDYAEFTMYTNYITDTIKSTYNDKFILPILKEFLSFKDDLDNLKNYKIILPTGRIIQFNDTYNKKLLFVDNIYLNDCTKLEEDLNDLDINIEIIERNMLNIFFFYAKKYNHTYGFLTRELRDSIQNFSYYLNFNSLIITFKNKLNKNKPLKVDSNINSIIDSLLKLQLKFSII